MGKRQKVLHWIGKLRVLQGELEHNPTVLLASLTLDDALKALDDAARSFYRSDEDPQREDGRYESHNGAVIVSPWSVRGIAPEVFQALRSDLMVRLGAGVTAEDIAATKAPTGEQGLELLEAFEAYAGCVRAGASSQASAASRAEQLLAECSKRAAEIRQSMV